MGIESFSGVSWLHDRLIKESSDRLDHLKDGLSEGVPLEDYAQIVGRCKELKRLINITVPELFTDFYQSDAEDGEDD